MGVDLALMWSQTLLPVGDFQHRVGQCCGEQDRGLRVVRCTLVKNTTRAKSARGTPYQASQHHPLFTLCPLSSAWLAVNMGVHRRGRPPGSRGAPAQCQRVRGARTVQWSRTRAKSGCSIVRQATPSQPDAKGRAPRAHCHRVRMISAIG